jgi:hypothetical protein
LAAAFLKLFCAYTNYSITVLKHYIYGYPMRIRVNDIKEKAVACFCCCGASKDAAFAILKSKPCGSILLVLGI